MKIVLLRLVACLLLFQPCVQLSTEGVQTTKEKQESPIWTVFPSAIIAGLGVIFNLISLSYFIRREYDSLGWSICCIYYCKSKQSLKFQFQ